MRNQKGGIKFEGDAMVFNKNPTAIRFSITFCILYMILGPSYKN
jgi:hypothetical protein